MAVNEEFILFLIFVILFPLVVIYSGKNQPFILFAVIVCILIAYRWKCKMNSTEEEYERMGHFPWNEARLVRKRIPDSTTIDCGWSLDQKMQDNIFRMDDPVVADYSNQSEQE